MGDQHFDVIIVGGGQAGAHAALMLRRGKFGGSIAILGDELDLPYDRPPLSKEYLVGEKDFDRMLFSTEQHWAEQEVAMRLGCRVAAVDASAQIVTTESGESFHYSDLIWAAGGTARRLSCAGADVNGVHTVRTRADVDQMRKEIPSVKRAIVIGGGYIGLEVAAALRKFDVEVVLLEALDRVLARVAGEPLSRFYEAEHRAHGVGVRLGAIVDRIDSKDGRASGVCLQDGTRIPADMVVVGIGIAPEIGPLVDAGAEAWNGVRVDEFCRTSLPHIYAVGDCAEHRNRFARNQWVRIESVQNANDQAATAARAICGKPEPYSAAPWFWSNQYDLRLQTVGLSGGFDDIVVRGDPATRNFSVVYLKEGQILALDCVNMARDYAQGRAMVQNGVTASPLVLADTTVPLKSLLQPPVR